MYRVYSIKDTVRVPPAFFSMELKDAVTQILRDKYERKIDKDMGIVLSIWNSHDISDGRVIPGDGASYHYVTFDALAYLPEINEVFEGEITELVEFGAFVRLGPLEGLVHLSQITNDFLTYDKKLPAFVGKESKKVVRKGDLVRAKVSTVSLKGSIPETKAGLTMRPEGLGKLEWLGAAAGEKKAEPEKKEAKKKGEKKEKKEKGEKKEEKKEEKK